MNETVLPGTRKESLVQLEDFAGMVEGRDIWLEGKGIGVMSTGGTPGSCAGREAVKHTPLPTPPGCLLPPTACLSGL